MKIYEPCARVIESCNLATVVMFAEDIQQEESQSKSKPVAIAIQNKVRSNKKNIKSCFSGTPASV